VPHRARPALSPRHPVHVTVRLRAGLPSLRRHASRRAIEGCFAACGTRFGLRVVHYSIQSNHAHLVVESAGKGSLARGMQALLVRLARALNRVWDRRGSVFSDRYHARTLRTPREVRAALVYVLQNARRHGFRGTGLDPYSSALAFDGWTRLVRTVEPPGTPAAKTWLLRVGWRRHGLIRPDESPRNGTAHSALRDGPRGR
jgi:REP element-mobilizing transposase RayT